MLYDAPDWAPPFGIRRPAVLPPDDAITDAQCALAAAVEHAYLDLKLVGAGPGSDAGLGWTSPQLDGDGARYASVSPVMGWSPGSSHVRPAPTLAAPALPRQAAIPARVANPRAGRSPLDDAMPTPATSTPGPVLPRGSGKNATDRRYPPPGRQQG